MSEPEKKTQPSGRESRLRWILIVGVGAAMLLYFIVGIFEQPMKADNFTNSFSTSPGGHSALRELLTKSGRTVTPGEVHLKLPEFNGAETETLAILEPRAGYVGRFSEEFDALFAAAREERCSLVIAFPKRRYEQVETDEGDDIVLEEYFVSLGSVQEILKATGFDRWLEVRRAKEPGQKVTWNRDLVGRNTPVEQSFEVHDFLQTFEVGDGTLDGRFDVLASAPDGAPVILRYRADEYQSNGGVFLVSDPDFLTNRFIANPGAADIANGLFRLTPQRGSIQVDEDLHGFSTEASLQYLAATPPGLWVTLSAFLLLVIFAWREATVLRPYTAEQQDRRARKFSIEGLARMMERAGEHEVAYGRIMRRSKLVLGGGGAEVQGAGMGGTRTIQKGKTGRITRVEGATSEERLIKAAARVAHQKRTGETAHND